MTSSEIRKRFLDFFAKRGHVILPSASLVPKNDPSVLFNTAGMQPLVPYLMGAPHPAGERLADCQKCVRTGDLDDIGDKRHFSFFEMLGNWSLGDYFKEEAIKWSYEFLTSKDEGLGLDPVRLYVTIFKGDDTAPFDQESKDIWMSIGIPEHRIYALTAEDNWWSPGDNGPCGPCSEMFYDMSGTTGDLSHDEFIQAVKDERVIELWNDVFMEYEKKDGKVIGKLSQKNVDTGAGLERISAVMQGKQTAYETDLFTTQMQFIEMNTKGNYDERSARIIADHVRTSAMLIADGVLPGNKDQGYVLRRLIRRAVVRANSIGLADDILVILRSNFAFKYEDIYPELKENKEKHDEVFKSEVVKFRKTLEQGLKEFEKGTDAFTLATTYGFPIELTLELAQEKGMNIDREAYDAQMKAHQDASRAGAEQKFKGGLANTSDMTVRLHTAHHLLLAALQQVLGPEVKQRGSNITEERLRMDFSFDRKMSDEEKKRVEDMVNGWIAQDLAVVRREMPRAEAESLGAEMEFGTKYPDTVSVYFVEDKNGTAISKEFCGGPHVERTSILGHFTLQKEEASSAGIRRIKATLS